MNPAATHREGLANVQIHVFELPHATYLPTNTNRVEELQTGDLLLTYCREDDSWWWHSTPIRDDLQVLADMPISL